MQEDTDFFDSFYSTPEPDTTPDSGIPETPDEPIGSEPESPIKDLEPPKVDEDFAMPEIVPEVVRSLQISDRDYMDDKRRALEAANETVKRRHPDIPSNTAHYRLLVEKQRDKLMKGMGRDKPVPAEPAPMPTSFPRVEKQNDEPTANERLEQRVAEEKRVTEGVKGRYGQVYEDQEAGAEGYRTAPSMGEVLSRSGERFVDAFSDLTEGNFSGYATNAAGFWGELILGLLPESGPGEAKAQEYAETAVREAKKRREAMIKRSEYKEAGLGSEEVTVLPYAEARFSPGTTDRVLQALSVDQQGLGEKLGAAFVNGIQDIGRFTAGSSALVSQLVDPNGVILDQNYMLQTAMRLNGTEDLDVAAINLQNVDENTFATNAMVEITREIPSLVLDLAAALAAGGSSKVAVEALKNKTKVAIAKELVKQKRIRALPMAILNSNEVAGDQYVQAVQVHMENGATAEEATSIAAVEGVTAAVVTLTTEFVAGKTQMQKVLPDAFKDYFTRAVGTRVAVHLIKSGAAEITTEVIEEYGTNLITNGYVRGEETGIERLYRGDKAEIENLLLLATVAGTLGGATGAAGAFDGPATEQQLLDRINRRTMELRQDALDAHIDTLNLADDVEGLLSEVSDEALADVFLTNGDKSVTIDGQGKSGVTYEQEEVSPALAKIIFQRRHNLSNEEATIETLASIRPRPVDTRKLEEEDEQAAEQMAQSENTRGAINPDQIFSADETVKTEAIQKFVQDYPEDAERLANTASISRRMMEILFNRTNIRQNNVRNRYRFLTALQIAVKDIPAQQATAEPGSKTATVVSTSQTFKKEETQVVDTSNPSDTPDKPQRGPVAVEPVADPDPEPAPVATNKGITNSKRELHERINLLNEQLRRLGVGQSHVDVLSNLGLQAAPIANKPQQLEDLDLDDEVIRAEIEIVRNVTAVINMTGRPDNGFSLEPDPNNPDQVEASQYAESRNITILYFDTNQATAGFQLTNGIIAINKKRAGNGRALKMTLYHEAIHIFQERYPTEVENLAAAIFDIAPELVQRLLKRYESLYNANQKAREAQGLKAYKLSKEQLLKETPTALCDVLFDAIATDQEVLNELMRTQPNALMRFLNAILEALGIKAKLNPQQQRDLDALLELTVGTAVSEETDDTRRSEKFIAKDVGLTPDQIAQGATLLRGVLDLLKQDNSIHVTSADESANVNQSLSGPVVLNPLTATNKTRLERALQGTDKDSFSAQELHEMGIKDPSIARELKWRGFEDYYEEYRRQYKADNPKSKKLPKVKTQDLLDWLDLSQPDVAFLTATRGRQNKAKEPSSDLFIRPIYETIENLFKGMLKKTPVPITDFGQVVSRSEIEMVTGFFKGNVIYGEDISDVVEKQGMKIFDRQDVDKNVSYRRQKLQEIKGPPRIGISLQADRSAFINVHRNQGRMGVNLVLPLQVEIIKVTERDVDGVVFEASYTPVEFENVDLTEEKQYTIYKGFHDLAIEIDYKTLQSVLKGKAFLANNQDPDFPMDLYEFDKDFAQESFLEHEALTIGLAPKRFGGLSIKDEGNALLGNVGQKDTLIVELGEAYNADPDRKADATSRLDTKDVIALLAREDTQRPAYELSGHLSESFVANYVANLPNQSDLETVGYNPAYRRFWFDTNFADSFYETDRVEATNYGEVVLYSNSRNYKGQSGIIAPYAGTHHGQHGRQDLDPDDRSVPKGKLSLVSALSRPVEETSFNFSGTSSNANYISHYRFDVRTDYNGNKVLLVGEVQSDYTVDRHVQGTDVRSKASPDDIMVQVRRKKPDEPYAASVLIYNKASGRRNTVPLAPIAKALGLDSGSDTDDTIEAAILEHVAEYKANRFGVDKRTKAVRERAGSIKKTRKKVERSIDQRAFLALKTLNELLELGKERGVDVRPLTDKSNHKNGWFDSTMKHMIKQAVRQGCSRLAFVDGDMLNKLWAVPTKNRTDGTFHYTYIPETGELQIYDLQNKDVVDRIENRETLYIDEKDGKLDTSAIQNASSLYLHGFGTRILRPQINAMLANIREGKYTGNIEDKIITNGLTEHVQTSDLEGPQDRLLSDIQKFFKKGSGAGLGTAYKDKNHGILEFKLFGDAITDGGLADKPNLLMVDLTEEAQAAVDNEDSDLYLMNMSVVPENEDGDNFGEVAAEGEWEGHEGSRNESIVNQFLETFSGRSPQQAMPQGSILAEIQVGTQVDDLKDRKRFVGNILHTALLNKNPLVKAVASKMVHLEMMMNKKETLENERDARSYDILPKEYRANKGAKFFQLMDKVKVAPDEIDTDPKTKDLPLKVRSALKHFKARGEEMRLALIKNKREAIEKVAAYQTVDGMVDMANQNLADKDKWTTEYVRTRTGARRKVIVMGDGTVITKDEAPKFIAEIAIPQDWGYQYEHIHHAFFGEYKLGYIDLVEYEKAKKAGKTDWQARRIALKSMGAAATYAEATEKLKQISLEMNESVAKAALKTEDGKVQLIALPDANIPSDVAVRLSTGQHSKLLNELRKAADLTSGEIFNLTRGIVGTAKSKNAFYAAMLERKGAEGYSEDFLRVWSLQTRGYRRYMLAQQLREIVFPATEKMKSIGLNKWAKEYEDLYRFVISPAADENVTRAERFLDSVIQKTVGGTQDGKGVFFGLFDVGHRPLRRGLHVWRTIQYFRLLKTLRQHIINSFQPLQTVYPLVGETGMLRGVRLYHSRKGKAILKKYGPIADPSAYKDSPSGGSSIGPRGWRKTKRLAASVLPFIPYEIRSEVRNQNFAFLAMYDHAVRNLGMSELEAAEFATVRGVVMTQYAFTRTTQPPIMRGPITATAFQFKRFMINQIQLAMAMLKRGKNKDEYGTTGYGAFSRFASTQLILGGVRGLVPYVLYNMSKKGFCALFPETCKKSGPPEDDIEEFRLFLQDLTGSEDFSNAITHGFLAGMFEIDISGSVALLDRPYGRSMSEQFGNFVLGPTGNTMIRMYEDLQEKQNEPRTTLGIMGQTLLETSPAINSVKDFLEAVAEMELSGKQYFDNTGAFKFEATVGQRFVKMMGFRTMKETEISGQYQHQMAVARIIDRAKDEAATYASVGDVESALASITKHNAMFPEFIFSFKDIKARIKNKRTNRIVPVRERRTEKANPQMERYFRGKYE